MIRPYKTADKNKLLELLRLNTPQYFGTSEETDFINYLDKYADNYFVVEKEGRIIGCGGINYSEDRSSARISWDIIHPDFQGKGIGLKLIRYKINEIRNNSFARLIIVRTSQFAFKFYEKIGFRLEKTETDFWAKGFDLYQMQMVLN